MAKNLQLCVFVILLVTGFGPLTAEGNLKRSSTDILPDPVAFYPLNAHYKAAEKDHKQPDGILGDVSLTRGPHNEPNGAYEFFGNRSSYIEFPNNGGLETRHSITLMCWVNVQPGGKTGPLFNYGNYNSFMRYEPGIWIVSGRFSAEFGHPDWAANLKTSEALPVGSWVHVAATYDNITGIATLYLNGHFNKSTYISGVKMSTNATEVRMGAVDYRWTNFTLRGKVTQMKVYDVALNEAQIKASMNEVLPVAFYPLNAQYKAAEKDHKQADGILGDVSLTRGPHNEPNGAYEFYGNQSSYIEFPNNGGLYIGHSITLMCWVQPGGQDGPLFNYGKDVNFQLYIGIFNGSFIFHLFGIYGQPIGHHVKTSEALPVGTWVHVAATYDRNTGLSNLYVNGSFNNTKKIGDIDTDATEVRMGAVIGYHKFFKGKIAQMKVYDVALNEAQIKASMNEGPLCPPGKKTDDPQGRCCVFPFVYEGVSYDSCTKVAHHTFWCSLDANYTGERANCVNPCTKTPCHNGGTCLVTGDDSYRCQCAEGYDGNSCKKALVAIIYGGAEVIGGFNENITMDGSLSYDPETGDNKGMNFTWRQGIVQRNYLSSLQLLEQGSFIPVNLSAIKYDRSVDGRVRFVELNPNVANENTTVILNLTIVKDSRTSSVIQVVHLVKEKPPKIYQRCLINCGLKIIPSVKLSIETICQGSQCSNITSYEWILYQGDQSDPTVWKRTDNLQFITSTPLNSSRIVIKENSFAGGKNYRLAVLAKTTDGLAGMSAYDLSTSLPPGGGTCTITPSSGISLSTYFNLSCSGWTSHNTPLSYLFRYQLSNGLTSVVYHGLNTSAVSLLPSGNTLHNFTLNFTVSVIDSYNASTQFVNLSAQVRPVKKISSVTIKSELDELDKMEDINGAVQIANTLLEAIASSNGSTLDPSEVRKTKELIVEKIASFQVEDLPDLLQSSSVLGSATEDTETVSRRSLNISLSAVDSMTTLLMSKAKAKEAVDMPLITKSATNLGSCLNNMMKVGAVTASGSSDLGQGEHVVNQCMQLASTVSDAVLEVRLPDEGVISIQTSGMAFNLGRHTPAKLAGLKIESDNGKFVLPAQSDVLAILINNSFVDTQMLSIPFNPFTWDLTRERVASNVLSLNLKDDNHSVVEMSQLSSDIIIEIPLKTQSIPVKMPHFFTKNNSTRFHEITVDYENTMMQLEVAPADKMVNLTIHLRFGHRPTIKEHDFNATISSDESCIWSKLDQNSKNGCSPSHLNPIHVLAKKPGRYYLAVVTQSNRAKPHMRQKRSCFGQRRQKRSCVEIKSPPPTPPQSENVTVVPVYDPSNDHNYTLRVAMGSCVYWSDMRQKWLTDGCQVISATVNGSVKCSCDHLTSFGGSLLINPNPIDFDKALVEFKKLDETGNVAVIVTVAVAFMVYVLILVAARRADKKDDLRTLSSFTRSTKLRQSPSNTYRYEITITTGIWWKSGTTANVAMEIYGSKGTTRVMQLNFETASDDSMFCRGSLEVFSLTVDRPLGFIQAVRIGHDNSGTSPSWFLEDVVIRDRQTQESWTFSNNEWLALERGDGRIERMLELSVDKTTLKNDVLKRRWWKGLIVRHIWVSVLTKPPRDPFTRVQRASCCLSILLSAMVTNAMFYKLKGKSEQTIQVGPLKFSWEQAVIGIQSALIVAPINILVPFLFKKGSTRKTNQLTCATVTRKFLVYLAWFLCFSTYVVSATFTVIYSLVWEKTVSEQWLSSVLISFAQDVTINEPVKLFFIAVLLSAIMRVKNVQGDGSGHSVGEETGKAKRSKNRLWTMEIHEMEEMRRSQAKKENMSRFLLELLVYCAFVFILMVVCYGNNNDHRYFMTKSIRDRLTAYKNVSNNTLYWTWLRDDFLTSAYGRTWYNGQQEETSEYIGNKLSLLVGMPRLRQLRVRPSSCDVFDFMKEMFPVCHGEYSVRNEDTTPYSKPGWIPVDNVTNKDELNRLCPKPWRYQEASETFAGGFVADLGYNDQTSLAIIETLQNSKWLDVQSRFVMLEFSVFNPPTNLLAVATYVYEISPSSFSALIETIHIISLYSKETGSRQFYLVCELIFLVFVLFYTVRLCYKVFKLRSRFFKSFWNWAEIFQVVFSVLAVVMTIVRSVKVVWPVRKLKDNIYENVDFQEVISWKEAEDGVLGILAFFITLKFLRLFRFNDHVAILSRTMRESARLLPSFILFFIILFMAFLLFGMIIFGPASEEYPSFLQASYFQFELVLGKVKARPIQDLSETNRTFGRVFTASLLFGVTIMYMNLFISTLNDAISHAKSFVLRNELYELIDEKNSRNGKNEKFFDAISQSLKQETVKDKKSLSRSSKIEEGKRREKQEENEYVLLPTVCDDNVVHLSDVQCTEDITNAQFKKLHKKEKELFRRIDGIIQAHSEEEEELLYLASKFGYGAHTTVF